MKLIIAATAALTSLAGLGATTAHADTVIVSPPGIECISLPVDGTTVEVCYYCATVTIVPIVVATGAQDGTEACVPSPVGRP